MLYNPLAPDEMFSDAHEQAGERVDHESAFRRALIEEIERDQQCAQYQYTSAHLFRFIAGTCCEYSEGALTSQALRLEPGKIYEIEFKLVSTGEPFEAEWRNEVNKKLFFSSATSFTSSSARFVAAHKFIFSPYDKVDCRIRLHAPGTRPLPESYVIVRQLSRDKFSGGAK